MRDNNRQQSTIFDFNPTDAKNSSDDTGQKNLDHSSSQEMEQSEKNR